MAPAVMGMDWDSMQIQKSVHPSLVVVPIPITERMASSARDAGYPAMRDWIWDLDLDLDHHGTSPLPR